MDIIVIQNSVKILGDKPGKALRLLRQGRAQKDILAETGQAVGVADVSFSVTTGEIMVTMGLSGSGKSTLMRCVNRLADHQKHVKGWPRPVHDKSFMKCFACRSTKRAMPLGHDPYTAQAPSGDARSHAPVVGARRAGCAPAAAPATSGGCSPRRPASRHP